MPALLLWGRSTGEDLMGRGGGVAERGPVYHVIVSPLLPAAFAAVPPALSAARFVRRRRRTRRGLCRGCGYDLTGDVSGSCPECGGAILQGR